MCFIFAMISFVTNMGAPFGNIWGFEYPFAKAWGNLMNFAAYLFMGIPAGKMLTKYGYKKTALIALIVGIVGLCFQYLSSLVGAGTYVFTYDSIPVALNLVIYLLGAFICGFCVCMLNTVTNPMLNLLGGGGNRGNQLNMIGGTLNSLSGTLTPMLVGAIIGESLAGKTIADVNIMLYIAMCVFALLFLIIFVTPLAEPAGAGQQITYERSPWAFRHLTLGVIAIFFYVGIEVGVPATLISYLNPLVGFAAAGFVAGLYWLLMLVGRTIGSFVGGKVSSKTMICCVSVVAIVLMVAAMLLGDKVMINMPTGWDFAVAQMPIAALLIILVGLCTSVMWGCIFNLATEGLGKYTAKASGIFMMMVVGGGVVPYIQSIVAAHNILLSYIVPILGVAFILYYALWGSKNVNKDIKID